VEGIVTTVSWRGGDGGLRTTIVGKLSASLKAGSPPVLIASDPLVAFDRIATDPRFVDEAGETAPWTDRASINAYGGPLRFTFYPKGGEPLQITAARGAPVGRSMSNPERAQYAQKTPKRGQDGILSIPDEIDGRYFIAAPPSQCTAAIVGDERIVLEVRGVWVDTKLPSTVIVATVDVGGQSRAVTLAFDTLVVHGERQRIALVSRATLKGEATLVGHTLAPLPSPAARAMGAARGPSTAALNVADLQRGGPATPFGNSESGRDSSVVSPAPVVAATPFDKGFQPTDVTPGVGLTSTMPADDDVRARMAEALRKADAARAGAAEAPGASAKAAPAQQVAAPATPPAKKVIAPPKPLKMAKPRFKRH
jgi:hypothetical protein